ncbi:MAG: hypothetical protein KC615_06435 [Anaerolineae bacterium]|nr:hypothetical protein [Anaerolineae bacterium]
MTLFSLTDYGEMWLTYSGQGRLEVTDEEFDCEFDVGQMYSGKIYLICRFTGSYPSSSSDRSMILLEGTTRHGEVKLRGFATRKASRNNVGSLVYVTTVYELTYESGSDEIPQLSLSMPDSEVTGIRFYLTNMLFSGDIIIPGSRGYRFFECRLGEHDVKIQQDLDYNNRIELMKATGIAVTASLFIRGERTISDSLCDYVEIICNLLSIALCNKVNWIAYELVGEDESVVERIHRNRVTMPYSSFMLIDSLRLGNLREFLQSSYQPYVEFNQLVPYEQKEGPQKFTFMRFVTHMYLSAKGLGFIEMRALTLCSLVEVLTNVICDKLEYGKLLPRGDFGKIKSDLHKATENIIRSKLPDIDNVTISQFQNTIQNRRSLEDRLIRFIDEYRIPVDYILGESKGTDNIDDVGRFKRNRNKLTHQMKFQNDDSQGEYLFLLHFLDRIILAILQYDGKPYINVDDSPYLHGSNKPIFNLRSQSADL